MGSFQHKFLKNNPLTKLKRYQNKIITAAEVIEELIDLAKSIKKRDKEDNSLSGGVRNIMLKESI